MPSNYTYCTVYILLHTVAMNIHIHMSVSVRNWCKMYIHTYTSAHVHTHARTHARTYTHTHLSYEGSLWLDQLRRRRTQYAKTVKGNSLLSPSTIPYIAKCLRPIIFANFANEANPRKFLSRNLYAYNTYVIIITCVCSWCHNKMADQQTACSSFVCLLLTLKGL